jgi:phenylpropionate dioxygenase-like ring-hydroxylating dioxygenase large terminal subunit
MLKEENELLSRVGSGTPMGDFMRQYWVPAMPGAGLERDGAPERLRLLGQDLIAFRATDGRVGVLDEGCPHRGVSLALAHNKDCALTCIFHGWKIDVSGKVVDVPAEPPERRAAFAARVKVNHYPTHECAGILWVWLGGGDPAPFPKYNWTELPPSHVRIAIGVVKANWLNGLEGQLDSAHVGILHQDWATKDKTKFGSSNIDNATVDLAPRFEFEEQPYGFREAAVRTMPDGQHYVRVREFVMPWYSYIPQHGGREGMQLITISVPIDDEHSAQWDVRYNLVRPLTDSNWPSVTKATDMTPILGGIENRFGQDRGKIEDGKWSGFSVLRHEDYAVAMAQGVFADRVHEFLATSDIAIVRARRTLMNAAKQHAAGQKRSAEFDPAINWGLVRSFAEIIPKETDWRQLPRG